MAARVLPIRVYSWNYDGRVQCAVATTSWKKAAELAGTSVSHIRGYGSITRYKPDVDAAMKTPGVPVYRGISMPGTPGPEAFKPTAREAQQYQEEVRRKVFGYS